MEEQAKIREMLDVFLNEQLTYMILGNSTDKETMIKAKVRPVLLRGHLVFQVEELVGKQVFHKNLEPEEAKDYVMELLAGQFKNARVQSALGSADVLISKKGTITVRMKKNREAPVKIKAGEALADLAHNRTKKYILEEGTPVPYLVDLGVMTQDGRIVKSRYDKFRQINRFLEFIEDILPRLEKGREITIIDFGCGKSYLTFAMYHYLKEMKGYSIRVIGLDLKQDVIDFCNGLSEKFGFDHLKFYHGDIASYEGVSQVDMVVTLHACDTATDYALAKAVRWDARVILSVPCCQHEINGQIRNEILNPVLQYGLLKERMSALITDGIRAQILENQGYRTQILEFIDMEHTPKNILIRAVRQGGRKDNQTELEKLLKEFGLQPTLYQLLK